jgi:4-amino-4-deoxy-L-arabinose transferase-like glycosyltransferase
MSPDPHPANSRRKLSILLPLFFAGVLYLFSTTNRGVIDYDEGYYAQPARHMVESNDWVTPYVNGVRFLEKPPLLYWLTAGSFKIFGINEFALRFPTALAVIALVWIVMLMVRRVAGDRAVFIAGLSTACSTGTYLFTRETLHDIWMVLFITLALYAFFEWYLDPRHSLRSALLFYAALAGAVLCKSLIGAAFPIGIIIVFFLFSRELPEWRSFHLLPGILLFIGLSVPWHWLAEIRNTGFLDFFFLSEQFLRFFGKREPPVLWSVPLLVFWALVLVWFFPWTAFLPAAFKFLRKSVDYRQRSLARLAIAWIIVILGFFSFTDRLEHYAFPALPALSLLVALALDKLDDDQSIRRAFGGLALFGILALAVGMGAGIWFYSGRPFEFNAAGPTDRISEADFSILAYMPAGIVRDLIKPAAITILSMAIGFWIALRFEKHQRRVHAVISVAAVMMVVCGMIHWSLSICEDLISSKKFAIEIARASRPGDRLVLIGDYESANSLNFYQPLHVEVFDGVAYALIPGMKFPDAPKIVLTQKEFSAAWQSQGRVFVLLPNDRIGSLNPAGREMMRGLHRALVRNH